MELKDLAIKPEDMRNQIVIFKHCYEISVEDAYRIAQRKLLKVLENEGKIKCESKWSTCKHIWEHAVDCWLCKLKKDCGKHPNEIEEKC